MFRLEPDQMEQCWEILQNNAPESISWNHYDLAEYTEIKNITVWKAFLLEATVQEWLEEERTILQQYELSKLTRDVANSRSVGQAQLINSMEKLNSANRNKTTSGPIFVYTYIPLNAEQRAAPNVIELTEDIFLDKPSMESPIIFDDTALSPFNQE